MTRLECPICEDRDFKRLNNDTPYVQCNKCDFWYQIVLPDKVYEAAHEVSGDTMPHQEREANLQIAKRLYDLFLVDKPKAYALDIGAKFPWLMHCLNGVSENKVETWAVDGIPAIQKFCYDWDLGVKGFVCDFETAESYPWDDIKFDLICMVHIIEHFYNPMHTMSKVFNILKPDGKLFIRCPAHDVLGIERDFTEGHYTIHPQIWNKRSLEYAADSLGFKILLEQELVPGQRDTVWEKKK